MISQFLINPEIVSSSLIKVVSGTVVSSTKVVSGRVRFSSIVGAKEVSGRVEFSMAVEFNNLRRLALVVGVRKLVSIKLRSSIRTTESKKQ